LNTSLKKKKNGCRRSRSLKTLVTFLRINNKFHNLVTNKTPIMTDQIGQNIAKIRKLQGLSQENLGAYLGVTREQISHYERGTRKISVTDLNKLADLFGVELADLLEEDMDLQHLNLAFAFRSKKIESDLPTIATFKKLVLNYLKMQRLNAH